MRERDELIDNVRGLSMLIVIITHALVPYLSNPLILTVWDHIHFAVPMLVFCSGYMQFDPDKRAPALSVIGKRLSRLLIPYYVYAAAFICVGMIMGKLKPTLKYILLSLSVTGGVDVSWFVLLFICLGVISPLLLRLLKTHRVLFHAIAVASFASSVALLFNTPSIDYRWYMWIPWLLPYMFGHYFRQLRKSHMLMLVCIMPLTFAVAFILRDAAGRPLSLISNKYPPTLYYLAYGLTALMLISYAQHLAIFTNDIMRSAWKFLSVYSYPLFFIHYFLLFILDMFGIPRLFNPMVYILLVLMVTIGLQLAANKINAVPAGLQAGPKHKK